MTAAALLLLANVVVPVVWGDLYPFTSAPMFRDSPQLYCDYSIFTVDGQPLDPARFGCQRLYDGNPVGYGVGRVPPAVLEHFGTVRDEAAVRNHVRKQLERPGNRTLRQVVVVQQIVGPRPDGSVGVVHTDRWRVTLDAPYL